jgi:2-polyprenyl-3-methyl-5-hydroxy-6-metoxy-1,4-benzoquinol methylase
MKDKRRQINFDDYAADYEDILRKQLAFFSKDRGYFSAYKVDIAADICRISPTRIVDFGCGIGLILPHLANRFPNAQIYATDLSMKSLEYVRRTYPNIQVLSDDQLDGCTFDLIFISAVFHHISAAQRRLVMKRLAELLTETGMLCIFDHNPYNPVTRHLVSTCPFDADAELITARRMKALVNDTGLHISHSGYCLFFPQLLKWLRPLEKALAWLPLGGQYFVTAERKRSSSHHDPMASHDGRSSQEIP